MFMCMSDFFFPVAVQRNSTWFVFSKKRASNNMVTMTKQKKRLGFKNKQQNSQNKDFLLLLCDGLSAQLIWINWWLWRVITSVTFVVVSGRAPTTEQLTFKKVDCGLRLWLKSKWLFEFVSFFLLAMLLSPWCFVFLCCVWVRWSLAGWAFCPGRGRHCAVQCVRDGLHVFRWKTTFCVWVACQHVLVWQRKNHQSNNDGTSDGCFFNNTKPSYRKKQDHEPNDIGAVEAKMMQNCHRNAKWRCHFAFSPSAAVDANSDNDFKCNFLFLQRVCCHQTKQCLASLAQSIVATQSEIKKERLVVEWWLFFCTSWWFSFVCCFLCKTLHQSAGSFWTKCLLSKIWRHDGKVF